MGYTHDGHGRTTSRDGTVIISTSIVATTLVGMVLGMLIAHGYPDAPVEARALRSGLELTPYGMPEPGGGFTVGLQGAL